MAFSTTGVGPLLLVQWDDEPVPREPGLAPFDAFGSTEKTRHANPDPHAGVSAFEAASSERFFAWHFGRDARN